MLPSSLHAPIHRYFERLGEFLTENRDVLGESGRVKPFDVSFVHQSCDTLVVSTSLLSAHDRLPASSSSSSPAISHNSPFSTAHNGTTEPRTVGFEDSVPNGGDDDGSSSSDVNHERLSWLDVLSIIMPASFVPAHQPTLQEALYHNTTRASDLLLAEASPAPAPAQVASPSHIEQGRIATTTGRALCGALVDVMLAIIRHRQRQGWSTVVLIMSEEARRAVVLGLQESGTPIPEALLDMQPIGIISFSAQESKASVHHSSNHHNQQQHHVPRLNGNGTCNTSHSPMQPMQTTQPALPRMLAPFVLAYQHRDLDVTYATEELVDSQRFRRHIDSSFHDERLWANINFAVAVQDSSEDDDDDDDDDDGDNVDDNGEDGRDYADESDAGYGDSDSSASFYNGHHHHQQYHNMVLENYDHANSSNRMCEEEDDDDDGLEYYDDDYHTTIPVMLEGHAVIVPHDSATAVLSSPALLATHTPASSASAASGFYTRPSSTSAAPRPKTKKPRQHQSASSSTKMQQASSTGPPTPVPGSDVPPVETERRQKSQVPSAFKYKRRKYSAASDAPLVDGPKPTECSWRHCGAGDLGEHETLCLHVHEHIASMIPDMSVPNRKDRYKCGWLGCYFSSKSKNDITIHVRRIHIHERLQRCPKCPYECVPVSELIKHMRVKHGHHSS